MVEGDIASKPRRKKGTQHESRRRREATCPPHGFKLSTILREVRWGMGTGAGDEEAKVSVRSSLDHGGDTAWKNEQGASR